MSESGKPILYSYFRSSCAFRVRIAMNVKQIAYEIKTINIHPDVNAQLDDSYLALNPQARVPLFIDGNLKITQSTAIIEYLEERYPGPPLLPESATERALARQIVNTIACDIQPLNNISVLQKLGKLELPQTAISNWYEHWISKGFTALEAQLNGQNKTGDFCIANQFGMADVYLIPQVWNAHRFKVDLQGYPRIQEIYERGMQIPAVLAATPEKQPDAI
ncbi:Maleylpyruvate isomerase [Thalassocella blandensis]|nr:Maleylpyruvate isomerase [Thalassocella blandensis]